MKWYVKVTPIEGTQGPIEAEYLWGPFSTRRDAYAADKILLDHEHLAMHVFSGVYDEDTNGDLRPDVRMLSDASRPIDTDHTCSCGGNLRPAGKTLQDGHAVYACQDCLRLWAHVRDRFRCVGVRA
jgi:hypothetical protein